ncbi:MAG: leucyl aminopeptidase [Deltaproteobacteria bacterium]|nr:leucyl aminopeptidase [Deltaproteobacteria bacterium]MDQ3295005.1 leucyl aminopeptidase [Myxococcota bacterium]
MFGDPTRDAVFKAVDQALDGVLTDVCRSENFEAKTGQSLTVHTHGRLPARRVLIVGGGSRAEFTNPNIRDVAATVAQAAIKAGAVSVGMLLPNLGGNREALLVQMAVEGIYLGTYKFGRYLTGDDHKRPTSLKSFGFLTDLKGKKHSAAQTKSYASAIARGTAIAAAINHARDLINEPAAVITPAALAADAQAIAKKHKGSLTVTVLDPKKCAELGMGMFLAVGQGSDQEARFIHMTYKPAKKPKKRICFIGKGVTFDSGGYSLKPSQSMEDMKVDMSGAAAVISAMDAIATLGSDYEVHAVTACCENLVSGRAYKLGDVLTSMDGTTVEINNTDAEGRLTLGDAITYTRTKIQPDEMFDFATLTGACMVALGPYTAGVMSDHEQLVRSWMNVAERTGEDMWRLPLNMRLREQLKSPIADMRNTGDRFGGAITAGLFLKTFAKDTPWVHVDIAGPASLSSTRPSQPKGGTGFAVASIVEYATRH